MQHPEYIKDRYPGLRAFEKNQNSIFFGRETETMELFNLVSLEKVLVFFGKSGLGKSSLLNAGLSPLLEENGYLPIRIRFCSGNRDNESKKDDDTNLLLRDFIVAFRGFDNTHAILFDKEKAQVWEHVKSAPFNDKECNHRIPVFIFDQFEEFFYHPVHHQQEFLKQLSEIVHEQPPRRVLEWITNIPAASRTPAQMQWYQQPPVKIIFALRSDKLALMQSIVPYINTVLRNRYELKALTREQAASAITEPAIKDMGDGYTPPFRFNPATLKEIITELGQQSSNEIESSQLQMVCNYIEQRVRIRQDAEEGIQDIEVDNTIINPHTDIIAIRNNFYENQLLRITDLADRLLARKVIEDEMVIEGQRASLLEKQLIQELQGKKELIQLLQQARLIRDENTNRGLTYEVSHDTLIAPIEKSKQQRQAAEEKAKFRAEAEQRERQWKEAEQRREEAERQKNEADRLRKEAETQREEAMRQKKKVSVLYRIVIVTVLLFTIAGVMLFKVLVYNKEIAEKSLLIRKVDSVSIINQEMRMIDTAESILDKIPVTSTDTFLPDSISASNDTTIATIYDVLREAKDTTSYRYKRLLNNTYKKTKSLKKDAPGPEIKTVQQKIEYLDTKLPKVPEDQKMKYWLNNNIPIQKKAALKY